MTETLPASDLDERLREMWQAGVPSPQIGAALDRSASYIRTKARRMGLPQHASPAQRDSRWTDATTAELRNLAASGMAGAAICARLDVTLRTLEYRARLNKIRIPGLTSPKRTLAPHKRNAFLTSAARGTAASRLVDHRGRQDCEPNRRAALPVVPYVSMPVAPARCCQWPFGEPRAAGFRFCEAPTAHRSYCAEHATVAYVRVRDRREDAA